MSILAKGVDKKIAYRKETTWGVVAPDSGAKQLRRVTSQFNQKAEELQSAEIRQDYPISHNKVFAKHLLEDLNSFLPNTTVLT